MAARSPLRVGAAIEVEDTAADVDVDVNVDETVADEVSEDNIEELTVETLQAELEAQRQKADEHLNHLQRMQAEFNNYRRRMAQEKLQAASRGKEEILSSLLPVLNNPVWHCNMRIRIRSRFVKVFK
jgi:molecular chaperone GrpE